jgi:rod shape determining protein RodA
MEQLAIDQVLEKIRQHLNLTKQTERDLLDEIRTHLEDVVDEAVSQGRDPNQALIQAAEEFGVDEVGLELQQVHRDWESTDALVLIILPVLCALVLRWLAFAPDGSALGWPQLLVRPGFWIASAAALLIPFLYFTRWRLALVGWAIFWLLSVIFIIFPHANQW